MIVFSNKFKNSTLPLKDYEFQVLNELKDLSNRTDDNCLTHTKFLFEMDSVPLQEQIYKWIPTNKDKAVSIVYSGKKSVHFVVEFGPEHEALCKVWYKNIWNFINDTYFNGLCDKACSNPSRLTRRPGVVRKDTGKLQELLYSNEGNFISNNETFMKELRKHLIDCSYLNTIEDEKRLAKKQTSINEKSHNGLCKNYSTVTYYLNKSFPNRTGNGDSSISLFKAVLTCMKYKDQETLNDVLMKARRESWSEREIDHIIRSIEKKYI